jgi:hypothetical protein
LERVQERARGRAAAAAAGGRRRWRRRDHSAPLDPAASPLLLLTLEPVQREALKLLERDLALRRGGVHRERRGAATPGRGGARRRRWRSGGVGHGVGGDPRHRGGAFEAHRRVREAGARDFKKVERLLASRIPVRAPLLDADDSQRRLRCSDRPRGAGLGRLLGRDHEARAARAAVARGLPRALGASPPLPARWRGPRHRRTGA